MSYASNYAARAAIFDNGDPTDGDHVRSIYDELGASPGERLWPQKVTVSATAPASPSVGDFWIDTSVVLT